MKKECWNLENKQEAGNSDHSINRTPIVIVLVSAAFVAILNQTLLTVAFPHIMSDLNIDANTVQWLQSIFMLVNGIMIPITAFFINRFTTRQLFFAAMGFFGLGTLISSIAPSFSILLIGRVLQAMGAGVMMPLMQTILFLIYPVHKRGAAMGIFGMVIAFAPAIGPTLSGWLIDKFHWKSLFYVVLPIIVIDLILAYFLLKNITKQTNPKVDYQSIVLSTFGFGGLLYGFSSAGSYGWVSGHVLISIIIGAIALLWFILRQLNLAEPILEFRVFSSRMFTITTVIGMVSFVAMIGGAVIMPIFMQDMLGFTAMESGLAIMPGAIVMGLMSPITGRLFDLYGGRWLAVTGILITVITTYMFTNLTVDTTFFYMATVNMFRMFGISMVLMPVTTAGLNSLETRLIAHGTAMNNTMRQVAGSVGTALLVTIMTTKSIPEKGIQGLITGVNASFIAATLFATIALILAFFIKDPQRDVESMN